MQKEMSFSHVMVVKNSKNAVCSSDIKGD